MIASLTDVLDSWGRARPRIVGALGSDATALSAWHEASVAFMAEMATGGSDVVGARALWRSSIRSAHSQFVRHHWRALADVVDLGNLANSLYGLRERWPWLVASREEIALEERRSLPNKVGHEYKAAVVVAELLSSCPSAHALLDRARRPVPRAIDALGMLKATDHVDLGCARIRRQGAAALVELSSPEALNAEDDSVLDALEACVDLALLDDRVKVGVLRGAPVLNKKYAGRRVFCSGINLSKLFAGNLSYLYYVRRELGLVSKFYRGLSGGAGDSTDIEKPWIAAVDTHAIGGGCQLLLVMDHVIAERRSTLSLPARREGIIPGAANLRLARFIGGRAARRAVLFDRTISADSEEGRLLVDEVVAPDGMDAAIRSAVDELTSSALVSVAVNRKALRIAEEPIDVFRQYMAHFALAQADCHFSPALVRNLETHWVARRCAS